MNNILFLSKVNKKYLEEIKNYVNQFYVVSVDGREDAEKYINNTEILICYDGDVDIELIKKADKLKWIHLLSAGADNMPFKTLKERGIILTNSRGVHKYQISEQVLGYMLMFERGLNTFLRKQLNKEWDRSIRVSELFGKTICIIGIGSIGEEIARLSKEFGMKTIGVRRSGKPSKFIDEMYNDEDLLKAVSKSDYVICALPLTDDTYHMLNKEFFENMREGSYFINIGRGRVVDEKALIDALKNKKIEGAALDVFEEEPLPKNSPLWDMENVIITPHMAGISPYYMKRALEIIKSNLKAYLSEGEFINLIDLSRQY
ncbi:D-2-hydroxyacid dehydrogenase [Thermoanaerobacterium sp. RBIITD]|uniref:D-2-hydroxyacid dehydrogenase n=1 Tax=Thermoanaerobacterium sp. RBIITD TaxID=1550240 RepID=UPI000BB8F2C6|nr:D-2-hydroxyacid dehydrogenase [Thermoanaerobacterium sp. RBIITD]SNX53089.1 Phosphoglycerate dehydrogenase [Thermoanaerobacterium sp. RBIITD]